MPRVRYTGGATYTLRGGPTWDDGDAHDVGPDTAERLTERHDFELVDDAEAETSDDADATGEPFDPEAWLDQHYTERAAAVREGAVDEHLGKILQVETSSTVKDAVGERRDG